MRRFLKLEPLESRCLLAVHGGWIGEYFEDATRMQATNPSHGAMLVRHDAVIDFDWADRSPLDADSSKDGFAAVWTGHLQSDHSALHELLINTNPADGVRIWVDDDNVLDAWSGIADEETSVAVELHEDELTSVRIEYRDIAGPARIQLRWTSPKLPIEVIGPEWTPLSEKAQSRIDAAGVRGLLSEQYETLDPDFLTVSRTALGEVVIGERQPGFRRPADGRPEASFRYRGFLVPGASGLYQFRLSGGKASRLWIADDRQPTLAVQIAGTDIPTSIDQWHADPGQTSSSVFLTAGVARYIEARQISDSEAGGFAVQWRRLDARSSDWTDIPVEVLHPTKAKIGVRGVVSSAVDNEPAARLAFDVYRDDDFGRDLEVILHYGGSADRGTDYQNASSRVVIPAGRRSTRVELPVTDDGAPESIEQINVQVSPSDQYGLQSPARTRTTLTIYADTVPGGRPMLPNEPLRLSNIDQMIGGNNARYSNRIADGEDGYVSGTVLTIETLNSPPKAWSIRPRWYNTQTLADGEMFYAEFDYRSNQEDLTATFRMEKELTYENWGRTKLVAQPHWQRKRIPFQIDQPLARGDARIEFLAGHQPGTLEIANFRLLRFFPNSESGVSVLKEQAVLVSNTDALAGSQSFADFSNRTATASETVPFQHVMTVDVHTAAEKLWQIRPIWKTQTELRGGDAVIAEVWLRSDDAPFEIAARFEPTTPPFTASINYPITVANQWKRYELPFIVTGDYEASNARFDLRFGTSTGTLEIGGLMLYSAGPQPTLSELPRGTASYEGRDQQDDWRATAEQQINDLRRSVLQINVVDAGGNPVPGAKVKIKQTEHAFGFGNILKSSYLSDANNGRASDTEAARYRAIASRLFNQFTLEDALRWRAWETIQERAIETVDWVNEHSQQQRGHYVAWGAFKQPPDEVVNQYERLKAEEDQAAASAYLRDQIFAHVDDKPALLSGTIAGEDRPKIAQWDVVNHPVNHNEIWKILGGEMIAEIFRRTEQVVHPETLLFINEGGTVGDRNDNAGDDYFELIQGLLSDQTPIDGIGFMNHFDSATVPSPTEFKAKLDRFASLGLPLQATEFDIDRLQFDDQTQADYTEDYFLTIFAHPSMIGVVSWGFWEAAHWRSSDGAHWYSHDWESLPNADIWIDLVHRHWQTQTIGSTRVDGSYRTMAFHGSYDVEVTVDGEVFTAQAEAISEASSITVAVDVSADFGDAPEPFPTTRLQNGARHGPSNLRIGSLSDFEADGQPTSQAEGDTDDGVRSAATIRALSTEATVSSFLIDVPRQGRLDGWIDFNGDGDWFDPGETLFLESRSLKPGIHLVSFEVPSGSGNTSAFARFRFSSEGGLEPTGYADDGEVEDYLVSLRGGDMPVAAFVDLAVGAVTLDSDGTRITVGRGDQTAFQSRSDAIDSLRLNGTDENDDVRIAGLPAGFQAVKYHGGAGIDRLEIAVDHYFLELGTAGPYLLTDIEWIDLVDAESAILKVDYDGLKASTDSSHKLVVQLDEMDQIQFSTDRWCVSPAILIDGQMRHVVEHEDGGQVQIINSLPYQNPLNVFDVNRDGRVSALDALQVINRMSRSNVASITLNAPLEQSELPEHYYDVTGDHKVSPLDALSIINRLIEVR